LEGAQLWIDGVPAAPLSRTHPHLKQIENEAYRSARRVFGAQAGDPNVPVIEAEDPKAFLKRLSAKAAEPGAEVDFGFAIRTSDQNYIEEIAREIGVALTPENWDLLNSDMMAMERNCLEMLDKSGIRVREEGHAGDGDLVGTAWANLGTPGWDIVKRWADSDGQTLNCASGVETVFRPVAQILWRNVSDLGKSILDVQISFFDIEQLLGEARKPVPTTPIGREDPKSVFRRMSAAIYGQTKAYQAVLQYMPQEFKDAYMAKRFFEWEQNDLSFVDSWPVYDDGNENYPWSQVTYYFNYYTEDGKIYISAMARNSDGNHVHCDSAEVGTSEAAQLEKEYGPVSWKDSMIRYWEWVRDHGEDPLNYVHAPMVEVKKDWVVGFVRQGTQLQLAKLRQLTDKKPSPPAVPWPGVKAKAAENIDWKEALDYCLVNDEGITDATEEDVLKDGGKWDSKKRLVLKFSFASKLPDPNIRDRIVTQAEEALHELQAQPPA
jgi:hypothetical protein